LGKRQENDQVFVFYLVLLKILFDETFGIIAIFRMGDYPMTFE